ncbi:Transcription initiation factor TFIID subunit 5 [Rhizoctonia solani]|uniref:Transcription initiation factor TFIID subunit 5 n=1 Tax=Rhizoctonia solani TaxID=456999 RepID=A0A0K6FUR5_9AGAM|nr:Transcription initiation factor TFIID subunit 5 [Rhizoctonia solani]
MHLNNTMKKAHEYGSRFKKKIKKLFKMDQAPNRVATPAPTDSPQEDLTLHNPTSAASEASLAASTSPFVPNPGKPTVPTERQASPHPSLTPAETPVPGQHSTTASNRVMTPTPGSEQAPLITSPEPPQERALIEPSSQTANLAATGAPSTEPNLRKSSPPNNLPAPVASKSGTSSWIKSESWANLKACLDTLSQMAIASGSGPLKTTIEGIADCLGIFKDAAQGGQAYFELRSELDDLFQELHKCLKLSPSVVENVSDVCGLIQNEIDYVKTQQTRKIVRRLAEAEQDEDNVLECYRRIRKHLRGLSRKMAISTLDVVERQEMDRQLDKLVPALSARYKSGKSLGLGRRPCTEGTRTKVLDEMCEWVLTPNKGNIYWMNGMAGTGKTTIAYSLCERLVIESKHELGASFFCSRSLPECRDVGKIIPSIAYQLAQRFPQFCYALCKKIQSSPDALEGGPSSQFESLIVNALEDRQVREELPASTVIVIDALDECEDATSTRQILDALLAKSEGLPIKFVVSSRPEAAIRDRMEKNDRRLVLHELDKKEVQTDIKAYLREELAPIKPSDAEIEQLAERAGVPFIYAATVIRYIGCDDFGINPRGRLKNVLETPKKSRNQTEEIDELYATILEAAIGNRKLEEMEREDMMLVLNTVVCAKSPLTVDSLNGLLKLDSIERVKAALRPLRSVLHVTSPNMTVTTLHASFPDYLTDSSRSGNSMWHCDAAVHHQLLAQRCLEYIQDTRPQFNISQLPSSYLYDSEVEDLDARIEKFISAPLRYACLYWSAHLDASKSTTVSTFLMVLEEFLATNLLLWLEVMNLTKSITTCPGELTTVKRWAMVHGATEELINLIQDASRFALAIVSSPISQSTPHIYISMLPFLPAHSPIRKHYSHRFCGMIGVDGTALDRRKPLLAQWSSERANCVACSPDGTLVAKSALDSEGPVSLIDVSSGRLVRDISAGDIGTIRALAFSPNGTHVASGTEHKTIWVWDVRTGHLFLGPLSGHEGEIRSISYSHNGSRIISGCSDNTIRIWDAQSGKLALEPLKGHTGTINCIAVSSDNTWIVSGSNDGTACVWDMQTGRPALPPLTGHRWGVTSVAISSDKKFIATCSGESSVRVWDSQTGQPSKTLTRPSDDNTRVTSVAISPDSGHIIAGSGGAIQIWDATTGEAVARTHNDHYEDITMLAYSSDGTRIISHSTFWGSLCLYDALNAIVAVDSLPGHTEAVTSIDISPDAKHIVSGSSDNTLCIWDVIQGQLVLGPLTGHTKEVCFVQYSSDGNLILSLSWDGTLQQWDAQTGRLIEVNSPIMNKPTEGYPGFVVAAYSPDTRLIATISMGSDICVWDSGSGEPILGPIHTRMGGKALEFSTDGMTLITGWTDGSIRIWDTKSGQLISSIQHQGVLHTTGFAFSSDRSFSVVAELRDDPLTVRQITDSTEKQAPCSFTGHTDYISSVMFSREGNHVVSGSHDKTVHIWDVHTQKSIFGPLKGHTSRVRSVVYSPDGTYIASASNDKAIRIWNTSTRPECTPLIEWVLDNDGWVIDQQSRRLIWIPLDLRSSLVSPRNTMLLSRDGHVRLNFESALVGEAWVNC